MGSKLRFFLVLTAVIVLLSLAVAPHDLGNADSGIARANNDNDASKGVNVGAVESAEKTMQALENDKDESDEGSLRSGDMKNGGGIPDGRAIGDPVARYGAIGSSHTRTINRSHHRSQGLSSSVGRVWVLMSVFGPLLLLHLFS